MEGPWSIRSSEFARQVIGRIEHSKVFATYRMPPVSQSHHFHCGVPTTILFRKRTIKTFRPSLGRLVKCVECNRHPWLLILKHSPSPNSRRETLYTTMEISTTLILRTILIGQRQVCDQEMTQTTVQKQLATNHGNSNPPSDISTQAINK